MVTRLACVFALVGVIAQPVRPLDAHPLHSSFAELQRERSGAISVSVRLFADDFGAQLDSLGRESPGLLRDSIASRYVLRSVAIASRNGIATPLAWCGMRTEQNLTWVCVRSTGAVAGAFRFRNALMFDRFRDQISIVRWTSTGGARTFVLTGRAPEAALD